MDTKKTADRDVISQAAGKLVQRLSGDRGRSAAAFLEILYARALADDLSRKTADGLAQYAETLFDFIETPLDGLRVRARVDDGSESSRAAPALFLETVVRDQPFIVDSLRELIRVRGYELVSLLHPILSVERDSDAKGRVVGVRPPTEGGELLSVVSMGISGCTSAEARDALVADATETLAEAQGVAADFDAMLKQLDRVVESLENRLRPSTSADEQDEVRETIDFLRWLKRSNFVFLGYRAYQLAWHDDDAIVTVDAGSGLGILRDASRSSFREPRALSSLPEEMRQTVLDPKHTVIVHKTNAESRVMRHTRMDYVGVKEIDASGRVTGEQRFLGLFTGRAFNDLPSDIPILRRKLEKILEERHVVPGSHEHKEVFSIFTSIPKSELFVTHTPQLAEMIFGILTASRERDVRVSYRADKLERGVTVMVLLPREKFNTRCREQIQELLEDEFQGSLVDYRLALGDEPMARLHFYFVTPPGAISTPSISRLETKVVGLIRSWEDHLHEVLLGANETCDGEEIFARYGDAFPPNYTAQRTPKAAVEDVKLAEQALATGQIQVAVTPGESQREIPLSYLKIFQTGERLGLSLLMPILTHLGLDVVDEETFRLSPSTADGSAAQEVFLYSFRVLGPSACPLTPGAPSRNTEDTVLQVLRLEAEDDHFNTLVPLTGLSCREVRVLRAYGAYLKQLGNPWTGRTTSGTLIENHAVAKLLVQCFQARFDPALAVDRRAEVESEARARLNEGLAQVDAIQDDRILRSFENVIAATVRTNYYCTEESGADRQPALAFKILSESVLTMPEPRPHSEIFVSSPSVEGVHLRSGKVARGGLRWSSRNDDYRQEILGLMKAQRTKNAVIVPVGAKGGFVLKMVAGAGPSPEEIREQYEVYIRALLSVTDNATDGEIQHPEDVVIHDGEDPYLVVAADRGTAAFSDLANTIAASRSYWLGDAFASGGSHGYDHKKLGITARGAWECVERHFREFGIDPRTERFTAAGIGDMSGDVFGNGMLLSRKMALLAAFNHLHIFLDPAPDLAVAFEERQRLFGLPRSRWTDYDVDKISAGGGVYRRDAKEVHLSEAVRQMLDVPTAVLNGSELVRAILSMPVDLVWNGGIGTYIKASAESAHDVSDPANDDVRVDAIEVRAKVFGEGGNLGCTQLGRIEYAHGGGRVNTDFIDNSAGVDISDHEVNLKVLLASALERGQLTLAERDRFLESLAPRVCEQVLEDNRLQSGLLSREERLGAAWIDEHRFLVEDLSASGLLKRRVEELPSEQEFLTLRSAGTSLSRPSLSVLLAYAKIDAYSRVLATSLPDKPDLLPFLLSYFPEAVVTRFSDEVHVHPLRREITATAAVNHVVNAMGITFFHRLARLHGVSFEAILRATLVTFELGEANELLDRFAGHYEQRSVPLEVLYDAQARMSVGLEQVVLAGLSRGWGETPRAEVAKLWKRTSDSTLEAVLGELLEFDPTAEATVPDLPPEDLRALQLIEALSEALDVTDLCNRVKATVPIVLEVWRNVGAALQLRDIEEEAGRMTLSSADDFEARSTLLERARGYRRQVAAEVLRSRATGVEPDLPESAQLEKILEMVRVREPLSMSTLLVIVETLARISHQFRSD
jgi:glutamate dehydrogenase